MALDISATDAELQKPVNTIFRQTLLRNAKVRAPYFLGTVPGELEVKRGTATVTWRRIENLAASTTALAELTGVASYMQGRSSATLSKTDVTATVSKYGNLVILNEEADLFNFSGQMDKIMEVLGINAGQSLNQLQRNVSEDNLTIVRVGGAGSDGAIDKKLTLGSIRSVMNTLDKNSAMTFTPMAPASRNVGTAPLLDAYWALTHPDVAVDVSDMAGFKPVETYAGQVSTVRGEFGALTVAGRALRFLSSEDSSVEAGLGAAIGSTGLNGSTNVDLYNTVIIGRECVGSLGFGEEYPDGTFDAGDDLSPIQIINKQLGSGGTSDPYNEIATIAWKAWHTGAVLNANWGRVIRSGATKLNT